MNIIEKQRFFQSGHGPTYMRTPISRFATRTAWGLVTVGSGLAFYALGKLIVGKK